MRNHASATLACDFCVVVGATVRLFYEALYLMQATVSARIKLQETNLFVRLFDRKRRDIQLTPQGNRLVRHADVLIAGWRRTRQDVGRKTRQRKADSVTSIGLFTT